MFVDQIMWRIIILSVIPGIILLVQNGIYLNTSSKMLQQRRLMKTNVQLSLEIGDVIQSMQYERGLVTLFTIAHGDPGLNSRLLESFILTDDALEKLSKWMFKGPLKFQNKENFQQSLSMIRQQREKLTSMYVIDQYTKNIKVFIEWVINAVKEEKSSDIWTELVAFHMLINGKECVDTERALGTYYFTHGFQDQATLLRYEEQRILAETFLDKFEGYSVIARRLKSIHVDPNLQDIVNEMRQKLLTNDSHERSVELGIIWLDNMTSYISQLDSIKYGMVDYITKKTDEEIFKHKLDLTIDVIILVVTSIVAVTVSFVIYKISKNIETVKKCLQEKTTHLEKEQQRTESLLSQLVPAKIAKRMHRSIIEPEYFESVTVMFADISNFDTFINKSTADEVLQLVNDVFAVFEKRIDKYNVSKLGSTGNILMVASGLHQKHTDRHTEAVASLALDLRDRVNLIQVQQAYGEKVKLKIGICTGPVIAGVVDGKLPRYCLFGETVTEAQVMMDTCLPLQIQLSESTYKQLSRYKSFLMQERDDIPKKNGNPMKTTYWLCGNLNHTLTQIDLDVSEATEA